MSPYASLPLPSYVFLCLSLYLYLSVSLHIYISLPLVIRPGIILNITIHPIIIIVVVCSSSVALQGKESQVQCIDMGLTFGVWTFHAVLE